MKCVVLLLLTSLIAHASPRANCDRTLLSKTGFPNARYVYDLGGTSGTITLFRWISGEYQKNFISPYFHYQNGHYSYSLHPEIVMPYFYTELEDRLRDSGRLTSEEMELLQNYRSRTILVAQQNVLRDHLGRPSVDLVADQRPKPLTPRLSIRTQLNEHLELLVHHSEENVVHVISLGEFYQVFQTLGEEFTADELIAALKSKASRGRPAVR